MNATCTGRAVRRAQTLRAPTPAAVWRVTCCSLTTDPAKPKMVRHTHTHTRRRQGCSGNSSHKGHKRLELICFSVGNCSLQHNHIFMVRHPRVFTGLFTTKRCVTGVRGSKGTTPLHVFSLQGPVAHLSSVKTCFIDSLGLTFNRHSLLTWVFICCDSHYPHFCLLMEICT